MRLALGASLADGLVTDRSTPRLEEGFRRALGRSPRAAESRATEAQFFDERYRQLRRRLDDGAGLSAESSKATLAEQAAWIVTARVLMNLDEFITRE